MSLIDAPIALLDRLLARRTPSVQPDDAIARLVARTTGRIRPDPSYQRRLRGRVLNQYVAMREGLIPVPAARREMGRLGRSVLYASFGLAVSATAVGAASTQSLPGDPLYAVKLRLEEVRMDIAPPSVKPALAALALDERLSEVERLAAAGRWTLVTVAAEEANQAEATLVALGGGATTESARGLARHRKLLAMLLVAAPPSARGGIALAIEASSLPPAAQNNGNGGINGNAGGNDNDLAHGHQGNGIQGGGIGQNGGEESPAPGGTATPSDHSSPTPTPKPTHTPAPRSSHSARPSASPAA